MHIFSSSSHSVIFSKNCKAITSDGVNMLSYWRILKQALADFACFRDVTSLISKESRIQKLKSQNVSIDFIIQFESH